MKQLLSKCRNCIKLTVVLEVVLCLLTASAVPLYAQQIPVSAETPATEYVRMYINEVPYSGRAVLHADTTYVDLYEFTAEMNVCRASWDAVAETVQFAGTDIVMTVQNGAEYMEANGRYLWCPEGVFADETRAYVPLRAAAKALGAEVIWNAEEFAAYVVAGTAPIRPGNAYYVEDEVYWLSRIIYAEAGAEPFDGQIAVGNVVLNRTRAEIFPSTIYDVIFDREYGVQFTPTANGMIYCTPSEESIIAAKICLEGYSLSHEILYFINAALATNFWVPQNCEYVMTISGHDFYS